jgi:hypothetical protein
MNTDEPRTIFLRYAASSKVGDDIALNFRYYNFFTFAKKETLVRREAPILKPSILYRIESFQL